MNGFAKLPPHPWLDELRADPAQAVADLLTGRSDKYPYARLRDAEFLLRVMPRREEAEAEYAQLETALLDWLNERRREPWPARTKHGLPVYVAALIEVLNAVQLLGLRRVAGQLGELHNTYLRWLEPLRLGRATDPALELWRCHALLPADTRFLPHWMRFCVEAGNACPPTYLTVALQGLRELPQDEASINLRFALLGLAQRYLARREQSDAQAELRRYCATLRFVYPYGPKGWNEEWEKTLGELKPEQAKVVREALEGKTDAKPRKMEIKKVPVRQIDPNRFPDESKALAAELKTGKPVAALWPRIEKLFNESLAFSQQTGNSSYFVKSLGWIGDLALKRTPTPDATAHALLAWLSDAMEWERDDPYVWMLWAQCLDKLGAWEQCEWVYWEMRRYFPDNEHCRTELARLLMWQERNEEAMALLREAAERNPDKPASRVELARLLMAQGKERYPEAEQWLKQAAERNPDNAHVCVEQAHLLSLSGNTLDAIALLEKFGSIYGKNQFIKITLQQLRSGHTVNPLCRGVDEQDASAQALEAQNALVVPAENITVVPDPSSREAAKAARAAFRMALPNGLAQQGRVELEHALQEDPDDLLAAFYLDWARCLPEGYTAPPDAYALAVAQAYRSGEGKWDELVDHFPEQRRLTWGLHWLTTLRDGGELPEKEWAQLESLAERLDEKPSEAHTPLSAGEAIVARLVVSSRLADANPEAAKLDQQAQEIIALTINRNLDPIAITVH